MDKRWKNVAIELLAGPAWFPIVIFSAHVVASRAFEAYIALPSLDIPMHLLGGFAIAFFFLRALDSLRTNQLIQGFDPWLLGIVVFALTCAATVFWEFAEYVSDHTIGTHAQLSLEDTLLDMLLGILGGLPIIFAKIIRFRRDSGIRSRLG